MILFISDLHLSPERPEIIGLFLSFLAASQPQAEALYILGDLFEAWVGDDDDEPAYTPVKEALRTFSATLPVFFLAGNRDFLIGERFAAETGCRLLPEAVVVDLHGTPALLMHGDTLCADDTAYQSMRAQFRNSLWQRQFLAKPLAERRAMARALREQSRAETRSKREEIMDVTPASVVQTMRQHDVKHLIHGHTHRPGRHDFTLDGDAAARVVLGDWYDQGSVLECSEEQWTLRKIIAHPPPGIADSNFKTAI